QVGNARLLTGGTPCGGTAGSCRVHYEPFGDPLASDSAEPTVGFQGHENDGYSTYMRGRSYLTSTARFIQVDPSRDASTWSQYGFAANNPILKTDPTGHCIDGCVISGPVIATAVAAGVLVGHLSSPSSQDPNRSNAQVMADQIFEAVDLIGDAATSTVQTISEAMSSDSKMQQGSSGRGSREGRGRGANARDRRMVDAIAKEKEVDRRRFGKFIEEVKKEEGRGGADNFTADELRELADEFKEYAGDSSDNNNDNDTEPPPEE
ncbi:MAG: RHS repeat-associated core domain-containing protein, partial [Acidobacteriota bacterium]